MVLATTPGCNSASSDPDCQLPEFAETQSEGYCADGFAARYDVAFELGTAAQRTAFSGQVLLAQPAEDSHDGVAVAIACADPAVVSDPYWISPGDAETGARFAVGLRHQPEISCTVQFTAPPGSEIEPCLPWFIDVKGEAFCEPVDSLSVTVEELAPE